MDWCNHECGEEDVDWQVVPVPGKGLGIVAKRNMPAGYRIMVERGFSNPCAHPAIEDLTPENGTLIEKFNSNAILGDDTWPKWGVSLRISRLNHGCNANASISYCTNTEVNVVCAHRDIAAGEEICIHYHPDQMYMRFCKEIRLDANAIRDQMESYLFQIWQITCPDDCICKSQRVNELISRAIQLYRQIENAIRFKQLIPFHESIDQLITIVDSIPLDPFSNLRLKVYNLLLQFALCHVQQLSAKIHTSDMEEELYAVLAKKLRIYADSAFKMQSAISPFCKRTQHLKMIVQDAHLRVQIVETSV